MGVDPIKSLVVPRVLALTVIAPILGLIALLDALVTGGISVATMVPNGSLADYENTAKVFMTTTDIISLVLKLVVTGVFVGVVSCYKGLTSKGGTEGVGRSVNEAVLITFLGLWALNSLWEYALLPLFPNISVLRG
jgi:phospholipid/cholesterol/gamma-HCH transport system permease protein